MALRIEMRKKPPRFAGIGLQAEADVNDAYVRQRVAHWLLRLVDNRLIQLDSSFYSYAQNVVSEDLCEIFDAIDGWCQRTPSSSKSGRLMRAINNLEEIRHDISAWPEFLDDIFKYAPASLKEIMFVAARDVLATVIDETTRRDYNASPVKAGHGRLKKMFRMNSLEADVCELLYLCDGWHFIELYFDTHLSCMRTEGHRILASMLGVSAYELSEALSGKLVQMRFIDRDGYLSLEYNVRPFFEGLSTSKISHRYFRTAKGKSLPLDHFPLNELELSTMQEMLASNGGTPTHILFYGTPGTGKTSLAKSLATALGEDAFMIEAQEKIQGRHYSDSDASTCGFRRAAIEVCLNMTNGGRDGLVIVDEADLLLGTGRSYFQTGTRQDKGWLNDLLERPGLRMIWITNSVEGIEESVIRRFIFSLHFRPLGIRQRAKLWERILRRRKVKGLLGAEGIESFARKYELSAGAVDLAVRKGKEIAGRNGKRFREALQMSLDSSQMLLSGGTRKLGKRESPRMYSVDHLNVEGGIKAVLLQLQQFDRFLRHDTSGRQVNMNLLLYGPPGTGKTAFAHHIAATLDRKPLTRRASDIMDPYVGMTERRIAQTFQEAEREGSVLIIDEADSFIFTRDLAVRSWETSHVNEFLTQMENFRGLLVCTTNRLEGVDAASIRRFSRKLNFGYLTSSGNRGFYLCQLAQLATEKLNSEHLAHLDRLSNLTPGDFKLVRDRFEFMPRSAVTHEALVAALAEESRIKRHVSNSRPIGFMASKAGAS